MESVADRLRSRGSVEEQVGNPALGDAEADTAAIFEPALVAHRRHDGAVAGHGGDDAGASGKRLHEPAIDVGLDAAAEQMRPLPADLDEIGSISTGGDRGVERIERNGGIAVATDPLPQLPQLDGSGDLVTRRKPADPSRPAIHPVIAAVG